MKPFLLLPLVALLFACPQRPVGAIGARTHAEIGRMAIDQYLRSDPLVPDLAVLFQGEDTIRAFYSGCVFPDWGYGGLNPDAAEDSHWHPFLSAYADLLQRRFPPPWDAAARRHIAFFLGVVSHAVTDIPWHFSDERDKSFLQAGLEADGAGHVDIEVGCDVILYAERSLKPSMNIGAWFPLDFLLEVFEAHGRPVTREQLEKGTACAQAMFFGGWMAGALQGRAHADRMPWVYRHLEDYYYGGLNHGAAITAVMTRHYVARLSGNTFLQHMPLYAPYVRGDGNWAPVLAIQDTHLQEHVPMHNAGAEPLLKLSTGEAGETRTLVRIDLTTHRPGGLLKRARLLLCLAGMEGMPGRVHAHRMRRAWSPGTKCSDGVDGSKGLPADAGDATWFQAGTEPWSAPGTAPGTDYEAEEAGNAALHPETSTGSWVMLDITDAAQGWMENPESNHGLLLRLDAGAAPSALLFYSSEAFRGGTDGFCGGTRVAFRPALYMEGE